ncbi:MAG: metal-sulfur cluster assembly factor [Polyangiaceae bacterium]|nr:metal-sulfur cluster assembly factor [Polyangiaceae bacterium]
MEPPDDVRQQVIDALGGVVDPEIGLDIVSLQLVYEVEVRDDEVDVTFTLTTPGCPMEHIISDGIRRAALQVPGIHYVNPILVWEPRWNPAQVEGLL